MDLQLYYFGKVMKKHDKKEGVYLHVGSTHIIGGAVIHLHQLSVMKLLKGFKATLDTADLRQLLKYSSYHIPMGSRPNNFSVTEGFLQKHGKKIKPTKKDLVLCTPETMELFYELLVAKGQV